MSLSIRTLLAITVPSHLDALIDFPITRLLYPNEELVRTNPGHATFQLPKATVTWTVNV